ncbi:MAG: NAD-dependent epimerase/dehydratase family protein [Bacteroidales bacterium]|nr:NAD-dependent epimerase/dehydratase family protein [Bacteroidales bacterium]
MNNRIYLVTGAAGFLGGIICRQLVERGERVRVFVLPNDKAASFLPEAVEICEGDLCDPASLQRFFDVADNLKIVVIHSASIVTVNPEYNQKVMDVNVGGTQNIIAQCRQHANFEKLVYVSSTGCIPELPKGRAIREISHFSPEGLRDCYSQSKALATQAVLDAAAAGMNACVVHPTGIMGPEDFAVGHTTRVFADIINGKMSAAISGTTNLVDVRDLAAGTIAAVDRGRKGSCYILGNEAASFKRFSRLVAQESGCKKIRFFLPGKLAYWLAGIMEKRATKTGKCPAMTTYAVWNLIRNNEFDCRKARRELGYTTRSWEETIHDQIAWMKSVYLI